jgi:hypothetical protein
MTDLPLDVSDDLAGIRTSSVKVLSSHAKLNDEAA